MTPAPKAAADRTIPAVPDRRRWLLIGAGLIVFHLSLLVPGGGIWLPAAGIGLALVAWTRWTAAAPLGVDYLIVRVLAGDSIIMATSDAIFLAGQLGLSWWCYHRLAQGTRRLEDPRSATLFLILVPGVIALAAALLTARVGTLLGQARFGFWTETTAVWIARAVGILILTPPLLVTITPLLVGSGLTAGEPRGQAPGGHDPTDWTFGEALEISGLCIATAFLGLVLGVLQMNGAFNLHLWGFNLLLVVWAALRQGLRGGGLAAAAGGMCGLSVVATLGGTIAELSSFQGAMLAQCSTALLVGASAGWIRASEARYRQVVGHIPVVLYSARLPRGLRAGPNGRGKDSVRPAVLQNAEITLMSAASRIILDCDPEQLYGPFTAWLERIDDADRELVVAAVAQLSRQNEPVSCEYRLRAKAPPPEESPSMTVMLQHIPRAPRERWVRDTLVPYHDSHGLLAGWEGVIEDITEQRGLAHDRRLTAGIFHALITNMPTGVFFVQAPHGRILLINARARKLLGQREDLAAGLEHLSRVYRLFRPDNTEYPWQELPVSRALLEGKVCEARDIVVHRPDGRHLTLVTWAAPVDLSALGQPSAAVWILEDLNGMLDKKVR